MNLCDGFSIKIRPIQTEYMKITVYKRCIEGLMMTL